VSWLSDIWISEKEGRIDHLLFNIYGAKIVKIGPADPEIVPLGSNQSATTQNWLPWQRPLRNGKNWTGLTTFTLIPFIWCKNRENRSS